MLRFAILTGFPHLSVALFGAVSQQGSIVAPRDFFADIVSHSVAGPGVDRLQRCLNSLLKAA
jgi:hypothetical protein